MTRTGARHWSVALAVAILVQTPSRVALADPSSAERAAVLKKQGDELFDAGKHADAYGAYSEAYAMTADPALLYNEGRALEAMGEYPEALEKLEQFGRAASPELRARVSGLDELVADVRGRVSTLVVRCNVEGARLLVRERHVGNVKGVTTVAVRAGPASVEVTADGYLPFRKEVELPGKGSATLEVNLVEKQSVAMVTVRAFPDGTQVLLDRVPYGPVPVEARIAPGTHALVARHEGYYDRDVSFTVTGGEHKALDLKLEAPPPVTARWWFWTGIGVVLVGGVVLSYAALSEKSSPSGTFSPGQVRGP